MIEVFQCPKCGSFDIEYDIETSKINCKNCNQTNKKNTIDFVEYAEKQVTNEKEKYDEDKLKAFQKGDDSEC